MFPASFGFKRPTDDRKDFHHDMPMQNSALLRNRDFCSSGAFGLRFEQILQGTGGALDVFEGVEFWVKGAPNKPYQVIGYIDGEFDDEWPAEDSLRSQISAKVKEIGGDGVVLNKRTTKWGGTYVINGVAYDGSDEIFDEYTVFRYVR